MDVESVYLSADSDVSSDDDQMADAFKLLKEKEKFNELEKERVKTSDDIVESLLRMPWDCCLDKDNEEDKIAV